MNPDNRNQQVELQHRAAWAQDAVADLAQSLAREHERADHLERVSSAYRDTLQTIAEHDHGGPCGVMASEALDRYPAWRRK